nr:probable cytochrome P450 301a1, mitochondrial [Penaeus vannamei]
MPYILTHKGRDTALTTCGMLARGSSGPYSGWICRDKHPSVFISEPGDIEHVLKSTAKNQQRDLFSSLKYVRDTHDFFKKDKSGIMSEQGDEWWRVRRRVQPYTAKPKHVELYLPQMDQVMLEFTERWASLRDEVNELPENFVEELYCWALETLGLVVFNKRLGYLEGNAEVETIVEMARAIFADVQELEVSSPQWWRLATTPKLRDLRRAHDILLRFVQSSVAESEAALETRSPDAEGDGLTLVEMLLLDPELSREDAHAYLMDLLTAGIDAVAIKAAFVLTLLAQHPEEQQKVHEELDAVLGDGTQPLTPQHLAKLRYTKACVKEVLRISSPSTLTSRQLVEDTVICGYLVPKGFNVNLLLRPAGKKEEYFARPAEFLPERWLRGQALRSINPYASMPFGLGTRSCVGRRLSEQQTYTLLARLLHKYRLEWHYGPLNPIMLFTLFPDKPLRLKMIDRKV